MNMERFTLFVNWRKGGGYIALWDLSKEKKIEKEIHQNNNKSYV